MQQRRITSDSNPNFKKWKKLHTRKGRNEFQAFLVEGQTLINEAHSSGLSLQEIIFCHQQINDFKEALSFGIPLYELDKSLFMQIAQTQTPQGVIAVVTMPLKGISDVLVSEKESTQWLLLDAIQDPGNLGTLLRTGDAAGIDGIILGNGSVDVYNPKVVRSAMGSLFRIPIIYDDLRKIIPLLKEHDITVIGTSPRAEKNLFHYRFPLKSALLLGNEGRGVHPIFHEYIDEEVNVPMPGSTESLNVSITGAIVLYEQVRQRIMVKEG